ncbi:hypothetical protein DBR11_20905 [Pedobacter sp. HMWF019]|uniref:hypothetical protein n=1 Tax=Pedobacter sp. HMWF019 TaxID=2056856 RepID=UPI000D368E3D|nr:hypothetical protein [Pedobacter sp. HMWF019]PTS95641.1 hypothetical protein DBR11_20905 [Pedobacter sp. HMWF019]
MTILTNDIYEQELQELWNTTATLLTDGWLETQPIPTQKEILYTIIFTTGTVGDKIKKFKDYNIDNKKIQLIDHIYTNLSAEARTNTLVIEGFILMIFAYLSGKDLCDYELQHAFVLEQIKQETSSYTLISHLPIYESEAESLHEHLNNLHNIIKELYYLEELRLSATWKQYPAGEYTILEMHLAQLLNSKQAFRAGLNTPEDQSIVFYGQTWILERMNENLKIGIKLSENLNRQIEFISMPQAQRDKIKSSLLHSLQQIQTCMDTCQINTLPIIKKFDY